jgi:hypothetical protein
VHPAGQTNGVAHVILVQIGASVAAIGVHGMSFERDKSVASIQLAAPKKSRLNSLYGARNL